MCFRVREGLHPGAGEEAPGAREGDGLGAVGGAEPAVDVDGVAFGRAQGDDEPVGNLLVGGPLGEEREDFQLAPGEPAGGRTARGRGCAQQFERPADLAAGHASPFAGAEQRDDPGAFLEDEAWSHVALDER